MEVMTLKVILIIPKWWWPWLHAVQPLALNISKWLTLKILRRVHLLNWLVDLNGILYCGNVHKCICTAFLKAFYFPKTNSSEKTKSSTVQAVWLPHKGRKERRAQTITASHRQTDPGQPSPAKNITHQKNGSLNRTDKSSPQDLRTRKIFLTKTIFPWTSQARTPQWSLTRGPGRLLPSDLAPILQYGNRPPSDSLAKILGVDTSPFLWNTRFYFTRSYL
jgi:hypothetical protein